jgi:hypothetical protein
MIVKSSSLATRNSMIEKVYSYPELKNCPIDTTFKIIGQKWTVLILREMFRGQTQFNRKLLAILLFPLNKLEDAKRKTDRLLFEESDTKFDG